jgi:hypothetical protein
MFKSVLAKFLLATSVAVFCAGSPAVAGPLSISAAAGLGVVTVNVFFANNVLTSVDVRGTSLANVSNPDPLGQVILTDAGISPIPGNTMLFLSDYPAENETLSLSFDFKHYTLSGSNLFAPGTASGTSLNPLLIPFLSPVIYEFNLISFTPFSDTSASAVYQFGGTQAPDTALPEPTGAWLLGAGLGMLALGRRSSQFRRKLKA